ncbi:hypothetical protein K505DRAFT_343700 [Melanomma pulvis-pyrius CBS 109.77]|uniref:Uncharacterized protein n=1 Tax=Melanomma pulvis-pyrius CBS 109.77 TaxID=1314802 RepID=A0A6A6WRY4_9PLEO|nr:hypothetical protein K505DRAFT_343700 [Melanomma pulvis-pyrius CBS 109.77]
MSANLDADEKCRSPKNTTNGLLLAHGYHDRPGSSSSSLRSERSAHTIIEDNPNGEERTANIKRQRTQRVKVHISRWACFLGFLFGPSKTADRVRATIEEPDMDYDYGEAFDHQKCPFFKTLSVISRSDGKPIDERCAFDTMSLFGNVVSLEFATKLGYTEADFKELRSREKTGLSSSGHAITPKGAIFLSWYHSTSPQYSNMRFLVVEDYHYDLLIGSEAIVRHKLMASPNFSQANGVSIVHEGDKNLQKLKRELKELKDKRDRRRHQQKKNPSDRSLDAKLKERERLVDLKELQINEYKAEKSLETDPQNPVKKELLERIQEDIRKLRQNAGSEKDMGKENVSSNKPDITVQVVAPNGKSRTPTGLSLFARKGPLTPRKQ